MAIYKPKNSKTNNWYIDFINPNGKRVRQSSGTDNKSHAQELHDRLKVEAWRVKNVGDKPKHSWQEAVVRYLRDKSDMKSMVTTKEVLRYLNQHLANKMINEIDRELIEQIKVHKREQGACTSTVNRTLNVLRAILNVAYKDWEWIDRVPIIKCYPEKAGVVRWLTHDEAKRLIEHLPKHLSAMVRFSLATGLRESNVTKLEWSQIDMQRRCAWVHATQSKSGKAISIPLNDNALMVLRSQIGNHSERVFTYAGKPITGRLTNTGWNSALKRADIKNFRWHDLRHTWASWHVQNGTPLHVLKELGGWADLKMVLRYAHLSSEHLSEYANNSAYDKILSYLQKTMDDKTAVNG